ncbi:MAG: 50S ribosomal protein L14e [Candidatus Aenigmarchaeota archaeon]|nr:50S ribosomal protein L14e [Candidatus Aenigmarchaeota archaeon]
MASLEVGTVGIKIVGREGGMICTVVKKLDKSFVMITGPKLVSGIKRRKCNIAHIEPTSYKLDISEDASDEQIIEAYKKAGIVSKFKLKLPSAGEMKNVKVKKAKEEPEKKESKKEK